MANDNKRNFFRVDILIPVKWQILNKAETDFLKKGLSCTLLQQNGLQNPIEKIPEQSSSSTKDDQISRSFLLLNNKLDMIINLMLSEPEAISARDNVVEISASGLRFKTMEKIDTGVLLKMNMIIPGTSSFQIELIAETLRVEKIDTGYIIAVNIICIDDDARDFIVKMIFQKQRIDIRRLKTSKEISNSD